MKSLIRFGVLLGLLSANLFLSPSLPSRLVSSSWWGTPAAMALTEAEILEKLNSVLVFAVTDSNGAPLVATMEAESTASVAGVFISRQDAITFVDNLKQQNPDLASAVQVTPVPLGQVYKMSLNASEIQFDYVPVQQQVNSARELLNQQEFSGVPLFIAKQNTSEGGYLTIQRGEQEVIPFFFHKEDLQGMLENFKAQQPDLISSVEIDVVSLEGLLQTFQQEDDQFLNRIVLIPPRETIQFIESLRQQQQGN